MITLAKTRAYFGRTRRILIVALASVVLPGLASGDPAKPTVQTYSPDGTYTVEYDIFYYCGYVMSDVRLWELAPGSSWTQVNDNNYDGLMDFSKTIEGEYRYQLRVYCVDEWGEDEWMEWSDIASVNVDLYNGPPIEYSSTEEQVRFTYEVRVGDINSDALQDIFVTRTSGGMAFDGSIGSVMLRNSGNGSFTFMSPTTTQLSAAQSWPISTIPVLLDDLNADNYLDVVLRYIGNVIPGAMDQIVFAPGQPYFSEPLAIRSIDADLVSFVNDADAWNSDPNYIEDNTVWVDGGYWYTVWTCNWEWWGGDWSYECYPYAYWVDQTYPTYPGIDQDVIDMWHDFEEYKNGSGSYSDIFYAVQSAVGAPLGASDDCGELFDPDVPDDVECQAVTISEALAAVRRTIEWLNTDQEMFFGREPGFVYITTHPVFGFGPNHMAVEYRDPLSKAANWVGAYPKSVNSPWGWVYIWLTSEIRGETDFPANNTVVAKIWSASPPSEYFNDILDANEAYRDCLPYEFFPSTTQSTDYNSNGFVAGIVSATQGIPDFARYPFPGGFDSFIGGEVPVPDVEFTSDAQACPF